MTFNKEKFLSIIVDAKGNVSSQRASSKYFTKHGYSELWEEFLSATNMWNDVTEGFRAKSVLLNVENRPVCHCGKPVNFIGTRLSQCCSVECERSIGFKPVKSVPKTTYNETGKRAQSIKEKTVQKSNFETEEELIVAIRRGIEVDVLTLAEVSTLTGIGVDSVKRIMKENDINIDQSKTLKRTMMNKYGVSNPMDIQEFRDKVSVGVKTTLSERGEEITKKRMNTIKASQETPDYDSEVTTNFLDDLV